MREEIKHLSIDEYVHMVKFMLLQCIYRIPCEHKWRESDSFSFFFLVPHLEDKVLLKLKRPGFAVARLIRCSVLGRKGQMLRWKGGKEPVTLGGRDR